MRIYHIDLVESRVSSLIPTYTKPIIPLSRNHTNSFSLLTPQSVVLAAYEATHYKSDLHFSRYIIAHMTSSVISL